MNELQRIEHLKKLAEAQGENPDEHTYTVRWRDSDIHPVVIKVDTSFLRYRIESGRTRRKQMEYLEKYPQAPRDLFRDPETDAAQNAQHKILRGMVDKAGLRKDIVNEGQRQPAIITYDGYVLNGNRRLAALRDEGTQYMDCVVLPKDAMPRDLYELELDLQMAKETKAEYNWVDELLHIRYGIDELGEDVSVVAKNMRRKKQEIKSKIGMLHLVDFYLEWLGKPDQHYLVGDKDEQVFGDLEKYTRKLKYPEKQKIFREEVFAMLKDRPSVGRLYGYVKDLFKNFDAIQEKISAGVSDTIEVERRKEDDTPDLGSESPDDPMRALAKNKDTSEEDTILRQVSPIFDTPDSAKESVQNLIDTIQDVDEAEREKSDKNAAFKAIKEAQRKLQGVTIDSTTLEIDAIYANLQEIIRKANELIRRIDDLAGSGDGEE
jgi:hypothetical protein